MGWASFVEDIVRRFDERSSFAHRGSKRKVRATPGVAMVQKDPSPEAVAAREFLEKEKRATEIAIREHRKNEKRVKEQQVVIAHVKKKVTEANQILKGYKSKVSDAIRANEQLSKRFKNFQGKFANRPNLSVSAQDHLSQSSVLVIVEKIENIRQSDLAALEAESRERYATFKAYASSQRRVMANDEEIASLEHELREAGLEEKTLRSFLNEIENDNRELGSEVKKFEGWEMMDEWLNKHPKIAPKEVASAEVQVQTKQPKKPAFNPVIKTLFPK